jgi:hypothetical protein
LVTKKSIVAILNNPPFSDKVDINKLPYEALIAAQKINKKLVFPLSLETMLEILRIAKEYEGSMVRNIDFVDLSGVMQSDEMEFQAGNQHKQPSNTVQL